MTKALWWERWPGRLETEIEELEAAGATVERDIDFEASHRAVRLRVEYPHGDKRLHLKVDFPDHYPRFRPLLTADDAYDRHQDPVNRILCLLPSGTAAWTSADSVASVLNSQLDDFFGSQPDGSGMLPAEANESEEAETVTGYYATEPESMVLVDSAFPLSGFDGGSLVIGVEEGRKDGPLLRGAVLAVKDTGAKTVATANDALGRRYPHEVGGRWQRIDAFPKSGDPAEVLAAAVERQPALETPRFVWTPGADSRQLDILGVVASEEVRHREVGDAWVFLVRTKTRTTKQERAAGASGSLPHLVQAHRAGPEDLAIRIPEMSPLSDMKVVVVGAGGLGAPSVIEFAKAQVNDITIVEPEPLEPGNSVRYPIGVYAAGYAKARLLRDFVAMNWPYTDVGIAGLRLGEPPLRRIVNDPQTTEQDVLHEVLAGAHLVYDAAAEHAVSVVLSELAAEFSIPHVVVSATEGGWGGRVARFLPAPDQPCWSCLLHHIADEPDEDAGKPGRLVPPSNPAGTVEPKGCSHPTFTGSGVDVAEVALNGVRLAISTMCSAHDGGYPASNWNVGVLRLRGADDSSIPCTSETHTIKVHPDCGAWKHQQSG